MLRWFGTGTIHSTWGWKLTDSVATTSPVPLSVPKVAFKDPGRKQTTALTFPAWSSMKASATTAEILNAKCKWHFALSDLGISLANKVIFVLPNFVAIAGSMLTNVGRGSSLNGAENGKTERPPSVDRPMCSGYIDT
jgi:hypothetical protein